MITDGSPMARGASPPWTPMLTLSPRYWMCLHEGDWTAARMLIRACLCDLNRKIFPPHTGILSCFFNRNQAFSIVSNSHIKCRPSRTAFIAFFFKSSMILHSFFNITTPLRFHPGIQIFLLFRLRFDASMPAIASKYNVSSIVSPFT